MPLQPTIVKELKPTNILTKQINITNNKFEVPNYFYVFATNLPFIMYGKHAFFLFLHFAYPSSLCILAALPTLCAVLF